MCVIVVCGRLCSRNIIVGINGEGVLEHTTADSETMFTLFFDVIKVLYTARVLGAVSTKAVGNSPRRLLPLCRHRHQRHEFARTINTYVGIFVAYGLQAGAGLKVGWGSKPRLPSGTSKMMSMMLQPTAVALCDYHLTVVPYAVVCKM